MPPKSTEAIADAKAHTGLTWREVAALTGLSHSYLVLIAQGKRVPSDVTVEAITDHLPIEPYALERLRQVAVPKTRYPTRPVVR